MAPVIVEQALHGYDHGHGLLAASVELTRAEAGLCERLSDLSGYLPPELEIPPHLTVFPCGRFYAVARTWPDRSGRRAGTVLTHTLLVPDDALGHVESLSPLTALHREPTGIADREAYVRPIELPSAPSEPWTQAASDGLFAGLAARLFSRADRPVTVVTDSFAEFDVDRLWRVLWAGARMRLTVSTFALGVRRAERAPFDILIVPTLARASVVELARSEGWWEPLRNRSQEIPGVHDQAWFGEMLTQGPAWRDDLVRWCEARSLPMPATGAVARLERVRALDVASRTRVTAARSRVDAISAIWPSLPVAHPVLRASLSALVTLQPFADDQPSPLRSLRDLVERAPVARLTAIDTEFEASVAHVMRQEVGARAGRLPVAVFAELPQLATALQRHAVWDALCEGAADALRAREDWSWRWDLLLTLDHLVLRHAILARVFERATAHERLLGVHSLPSSTPECELHALAGVLLRVAHRELDAPLIVEAYSRLHQHARGGRRGIAMVLAMHAPGDDARAALEALPAAARVAWCLEDVAPAWQQFAALHGARWTRDESVPVDELVVACAKVEHGTSLLASWIDDAPRETASSFLVAHPSIATRIVDAALADPAYVSHHRPAVDAAIEAAHPDLLTVPSTLALLVSDSAPAVVDAIYAQRFESLVRSFVTATIPLQWLGLFETPGWHRRVGLSEIDNLSNVSIPTEVATDSWREVLPTCWHSFATLPQEFSSTARASLSRLLVAAMRNATVAAWNAAEATGCRWLADHAHDSLASRLAAEVLVAMQRLEPDSAERWVPACFPLVYPALRAGQGRPFFDTTWRPQLGRWDEAEVWREWLTSLWTRRAFHARGYLVALQWSPRDVREALTSRVHGWFGHEFIGTLIDEVEETSSNHELLLVLVDLYNRARPWWVRPR